MGKKNSTTAEHDREAERLHKATLKYRETGRIEDAAELGRLLAERRGAMPEGFFEWLAGATGVKRRSAELYIRLAAHWPEIAQNMRKMGLKMTLRAAERLMRAGRNSAEPVAEPGDGSPAGEPFDHKSVAQITAGPRNRIGVAEASAGMEARYRQHYAPQRLGRPRVPIEGRSRLSRRALR